MTTPIDALQAWLRQPIYVTGIALYEQLIGADFLLTLFKMGVDDDNRERLHQALRTKLTELESQAEQTRASYPEALKSELGQSGLLMDERTVIKDRMRALYNSGITEGDELKRMAFRVLSITDALNGLYGKKNFFDQHGFLPEAASLADAEQSAADLLRRRASVRTYVTKYQKELEQTLDAKRRTKLVNRLGQFQTELHDLAALLDQPVTP